MSYLKVRIPHCASEMYSCANYLLRFPFDSMYHSFKVLTAEFSTFPVPGWITWSHFMPLQLCLCCSVCLDCLLPRLISSVQSLTWVMDKSYGYFHVSKSTLTYKIFSQFYIYVVSQSLFFQHFWLKKEITVR